MLRFRSLTPALLAASIASLAFSSSALADVPPPNECGSMMDNGQPCTKAGPNYNEDGICLQTNCVATRPGFDGGSQCLLCLLPGYDAGPTSVLNKCEQASANCVALVPNGCPNGQVLSAAVG